MADNEQHALLLNGQSIGFRYQLDDEGAHITSEVGDFLLPADNVFATAEQVKEAMERYLTSGGIVLDSTDETSTGQPTVTEPIFRSNPCLLLVEGENRGESLEALLTEEGYDVILAQDAFDGISSLLKMNVDVVLSDVRLPRGDGIFLLKYVQGSSLDIPFFLMTSHGDLSDGEAEELGAAGMLYRPISAETLLDAVRSKIGRHSYYSDRKKEFFT